MLTQGATRAQVIRIQPDEAIYLKINNKVPGLGLHLDVTRLDLTYRERFAVPGPPLLVHPSGFFHMAPSSVSKAVSRTVQCCNTPEQARTWPVKSQACLLRSHRLERRA